MRLPTPAQTPALLWTVLACLAVRAQLAARRPWHAVRVPPPARAGAADTWVVAATLQRLRATCLPRTLVLQRWLSACGTPRDVVVGVATRPRFRAHAWLDGDRDGEGFSEISRRPPAPAAHQPANDPPAGASTTLQQTLVSLAVDRQTAGILRSFDAAGVPCLLLKGPTIARWLYTDGSSRPYGDIDLLVPPRSVPAAEEVLRGLGYLDTAAKHRPSERCEHSITYAAPGDRTAPVDLHHSLPPIPGPSEAVWAALSATAEPFVLAGVETRMPDAAARCMFLSLHAAAHGLEEQKPLEDLRRGLAVEPPATWEQARQLAVGLGAEAAYDIGLALVLGPSGALQESAAWRQAPVDLRLRAHSDTAARGSRSLNRALELPWTQGVALALSRLLPSPAALRAMEPQTQQAYLPALARRVVLVFTHLPAAVRQVRQARGARSS